jgi:HEAT repeat protein
MIDHSEVFRRAARRDFDGLEELLGAVNPEVRGRSAHALALLGARDKAESLTILLHDEAPRVRWDAAMALKHLGEEPCEPPDRAAWFVALEDWAEAARLGELAVPALLLALEAPWPETRAGAARCLGAAPAPQARTALESLLFDKSWEVRLGALAGLAPQADEALVESLVHLLLDAEHRVRLAAAKLLLWLHTNAALSDVGQRRIREQRRIIEQPHYRESRTVKKRSPLTGQMRYVAVGADFGIGLKWPEEGRDPESPHHGDSNVRA